MKQRGNIKIIIMIVILVVVALIGVQIYWVQNAMSLREEQFRQDIGKVLNTVVEKIEKEEALGYVRSHQFGSAILNNFYGQNTPSVIERTYLRDTMVERDDRKVLMSIQEKQRHDTSTGIRTREKLMSKIVSEGVNEQTGEASINLYVDDTISFYFRPQLFSSERRAGEKARLVDEIVSDMLSFRGLVPLEERISANQLDSLISNELNENGIVTDFSFLVADIDGKVRFQRFSESESEAILLKEGYRVSLFPNDMLNDQVFLYVYFPDQRKFVLSTMWSVLSVSGFLLLVVILVFYFMIRTIVRQKKWSEIRNDFINNMTHELKTPISTISLATEVLNDTGLSLPPEKRSNYINMIRDENKRLSVLVENVLQTALIDRGELKLKKEMVDLKILLNNLIQNFNIQVQKRAGKLRFESSVSEVVIEGDKIHLTNVFYNLLDNANKYSPNSPDIRVKLSESEEGVKISVQDHGIGIRKEDQSRIFESLYRVPSGNLHDVKGFGLGLSYVKSIIEKHKGKIYVKSEFGKGSTFEIMLPKINRL